MHPKASRGFSVSADTYDKGRPDYPKEACEHLWRALGLGPSKTVLDLGAGTGKFTTLLAKSGPSVIAVEPVAAMRARLAGLAGVRVLEGTAESIPLADASVDAVTVAQAFHWFDGPQALREIRRVLKPGGALGLIWNLRQETTAWERGISAIFDRYQGETPRYKDGGWKAAFEAEKLQYRAFPHVQRGSRETVAARVLSVSYIAALPAAERARVEAEVRALVASEPEPLELGYRTDVYVYFAR